MKTKKKILITGNTFSWNYGTMSLVLGLVESLSENSDRYFFYKGSVEKNNDLERYSKLVEAGQLKIYGFNKRSMPMAIANPVLTLFFPGFYMKSDVVLESPGEIPTDVSLFSQFLRFLVAKLFGKDFVIYACSIGPYNFGFTKIAARFLYNNVDLLLVREPITKRYLEELGVKEIQLTADHAFLMSAERNEELLELVQELKPFIGISVKHIYYNKWKTYSQLVGNTIEFITEDLERNVLLIPHGEEDKRPSRAVFRDYKNDRLHLLEKDYSPGELKYLISQAEFFIGSRIHSCISSLSSNIPTIIAVPRDDHRGLGILEFYGMQELLLDPSSEAPELRSLFEDSFGRKKEIKAILKENLPKVQRLAKKNAVLVDEFIKND